MKRCLGCMQTYNNELNICPHCGYAENTTPDEAIHMVPGTILQERFIIGKVVGCGGFGVTYIAWDKVLDHKVAIKEYLPSEFSTRMPGVSHLTIFEGDKTEQFGDGMQKFLDEARRLAKFQNEPGIVKIFDCFEENRTAYIVMEYLQGITLTQYLEEHGQIPEDKAVQMVLPILNSLKNVHREGIIHRDIAPDNIMVTDDGQVKLIDFGAARYATTSHSRSLTVIIKQGYSPVEQYQSRGNQGAYTDVYAMGSVLYRMITGCTPPDSMERNAYFENSHKDILEPMHKCVKGVSENKENAILNAMNIRIEDRSPDMDSLIKELTTDEPVARINGKIKKKDILKWPLWLKITIPMAMMGVIVLFVLLITGVIGFEFKKPREIAIPDGMTRVPRIVTMDEESAKNKLAEKKLNYIVTGAEYDSLIGAGCVLTQAMEVGSLVPVNSNLEVIISAGAECYDVPYLVGINKDVAIELLETNFFEYEISEEYSSVIEDDCVISQSVNGGTELEKGSVIKIKISKGRNPENTYNFSGNSMPDLNGKTFEEAQTICESYGILLKVIDYEYNDQLPNSCVITQSVAAGDEVSADMVVELVLSKGERIYKVPSVIYLSKENATAKMNERGFSCNIYYEFSETVAEGNVISQSIESGEIIDPNIVIILTVSKGLPRFDMIDVCGMQEGDAISALQELGLVVMVSYGYDVDVKVGNVISQSVTKYEKAYKGCEVEIVVCSDETLIEVPDCVGQWPQDWFFEDLKEMGFEVEHDIIDEVWHEDIEYTIISQSPKAGSMQKPGTKIIITYKNILPITEEENITEWWEEEPTLSTVPNETEKVTEKETEKATQAATQKPTETTTQEETTEKLTYGFIIPEGCYYYQNSTGKIYYEGEEFCEPISWFDKLVTSDYEYIKDAGYSWSVKVLDTSKSSYEELMGTIEGMAVWLNYYDFEEAKSKGTFEGCTNLVCAPDIPEGCTNLDYTFRGCCNLVNVSTIPSTVNSMERTFEECISLEKMPNIPENVKWLNFTFANCTNLITIRDIPETVVEMRGTFSGCTKMEETPYIPNDITDLAYTFDGCKNLKTVSNIPYGVTSLFCTFYDCESLEIVPEIPDTVEQMTYAFYYCTSLKEVKKIPNNAADMYGTFYGCSNLVTVGKIPQSVVNMSSTFSLCTNLTGNICINANPTEYTHCFGCVDFTAQNLTLSGTSTMLDELRATGFN